MNSSRLVGALVNPGIYLGGLIVAALIVLAYQYRPTYSIGLDTATDAPVLRAFNAGEVTPGGQHHFRWSMDNSSIVLQDVGRQDYDVTLSVNGGRPAGQPTAQLSISVSSTQVLSTTPAPQFADYSFRIPRELVGDGTLIVNLHSNAFSPPGDPRKLGVMVESVRVAPAGTPDRFAEPPLGPLVWIVSSALLLALVMSLLGWGVGGVLAGASSVGILSAALLVGDRLWLTSGHWYETWLPTLTAGAVLIGLVYFVGRWLLQAAGAEWTPLHRRVLLTLMLLVFAARLAGQLHPQMFIVDLMFHAHRFETVQSGQLLFTIESAEWGGRSTFYLPTAYIWMLPLQWLFDNELYVIKLFGVALSTLGGFVIFYLVRRTLGDGRTGVVAAFLYLTVPIAVLPFSWGITTNIFGEFFALLALAVMVTCYESMGPGRPAFWVLLFALLMALLSHPGVVQLTGAAVAFISIIWLLGRSKLGTAQGAGWALAALALAAGLSYVFYYSHFAADMINTLRQIQADRAAQAKPGTLHLKIGGSVADKSLGLIVQYVDNRRDWFFGGLRGFWQEAQAYYRVWPVTVAVLGYLVAWPGGLDATSPRLRAAARLGLAALGWACAVLLFAVVGWAINLYVRYSLFALPVLAIGSAVVLGWVWRKGRWGVLVTVMMLFFYAAEALALWQYRITYAFK